ncbi:hypothetical protein BGZ46_006844 [Entomortierella lignicola]|nr:hypothetical protein BGZ46_006844 [Entomortierella lignicola]
MVGEMTGVDSTMCRNNKIFMKMETPQETKKKMGVRADFIWRSLYTPEKDWAIAEGARVWDELSPKYTDKANFKLPRQLHDILILRSMEVGGPSKSRDIVVSGLLFGGPCIQRVSLCWGTKGGNITRLIKWKKSRLDPCVSNMTTSLLALHCLLLLRASTIHLMDRYEIANKEYNEERRQERLQEPDLERDVFEEWRDLLPSSPKS